METQHIPKPTDTQILAAIEKGKSERLIAQELGTNCMRIHRLKKKHSLNFETKVTRRTKEVEKVVGYYSSFGNAVNRIAKEKFYQNEGEYQTIQGYINTWKEVKDGMESMLNKLEI